MTNEETIDASRSFYLNYINTAPVDLELLCKDFGWVLRADHLKGEDGYLFYLNKSKKIYIYYNNSPTYIKTRRYRFTIAHEIGHIILGHHKLDQSSLSEYEIYIMEKQANIAAAEILMPYSKLRNMDYSDIGKLADYFMVSNDAMTSRLNSLGIIKDCKHKSDLSTKVAY